MFLDVGDELSEGSLFQFDKQPRLFPKHKCSLGFGPLPALFAQLHVEIPKQPCQNAAYLTVGQPGTKDISWNAAGGGWRSSSRLPNTIPWTVREWLKCRSLVVFVGFVVKPAFWYEALGVAEVILGSKGCPGVDSYRDLVAWSALLSDT